MTRYRTAAPLVVLAATFALFPARGSTQAVDAARDAAFSALQGRGHHAMGVDQSTSTHLFDALPDGGRIELQGDVDDPEGIAEIRRHLHGVQAAFGEGDFSTPAFVHAREVPGTAVMAARKDRIEYVYGDLVRGGELRLITSDPEALEAIHAFVAFQRDDHRAGRMDHGDAAFTAVHLPDGIRTVTASADPQVVQYLVAHVASMEQRLIEGEVFNISSPTLPTIFENYDRIHTEIEYSDTGVAVVQTSDDPTIVAALQAHAAEVTELVDEGIMSRLRRWPRAPGRWRPRRIVGGAPG